jgi:DnaJ-class molecular chaperone
VVTEHVVSIWDCLAGCNTEVADLLGAQYTVNIPPLTPPGSLMRLKDKGLRNQQGKTGDFLIRVQAKMPSTISEELLALIKAAQIK